MTMLDHRNEILQALTNALDACIEQEGTHLEGYVEERFEAYLTFHFKGTTSRIQSHPSIDFDEPIAPQIRRTKSVELYLKTEPSLNDE